MFDSSFACTDRILSECRIKIEKKEEAGKQRHRFEENNCYARRISLMVPLRGDTLNICDTFLSAPSLFSASTLSFLLLSF